LTKILKYDIIYKEIEKMLKCFCKHKWSILNKTGITSEFGWYKTVYILVCEKCGKIEKVEIK